MTHGEYNYGIRTATGWRDRATKGLSARGKVAQSAGIIGNRDRPNCNSSSGFAGFHPPRVTPELQPREGGTLLTGSDRRLTVREVAALLRVRPVTVYKLCKQRKLQHERIANAIRVPESAIWKYLAEFPAPPATVPASSVSDEEGKAG